METNTMLSEEVNVVFQFVGNTIDPQKITTILDIQPSKAHIKGAPVQKHPDRTYPSGYWGLESQIASELSLEKHVKSLLKILEPQLDAIKELISNGLRPVFFCGYFFSKDTSTIELEVDTMRRIANIGAKLEIHLYHGE